MVLFANRRLRRRDGVKRRLSKASSSTSVAQRYDRLCLDMKGLDSEDPIRILISGSPNERGGYHLAFLMTEDVSHSKGSLCLSE